MGHILAEVFKFSRSFRSSTNVDLTFRLLYWPVLFITIVVAWLFAEWQQPTRSSWSAGISLLSGGVLIAVALLLPVLGFVVLESRKPPVHEKLDDRL